MKNTPIADENPTKCYSCGKLFKTNQAFIRHKNRKTPCLIREIAPENVRNPSRCIFCNKIFSNKSHLTRHHNHCKIKNGGMDILVDKVRYDEELRILREQNQLLTARIEALENRPQIQPANINNGTINVTNNITVNNYLKPNLKHLLTDDLFKKTFKEHLVQTPMQLIPIIWFNPAAPENLSVYLVNKSTKETLVFDGDKWQTTSADKVSIELRSRAYEITSGLVAHPGMGLKGYEQIATNINNNLQDQEVIKQELERIYRSMIDNRQLVKV